MHKTLNIITIVLLSFLVLVLTGILVLGITRGNYFFGGEKLESVKNETFKLEGIKNIDLNLKTSDVNFILTDETELRIVQYGDKVKEKELYTAENNGDTLNVTDRASRTFCIGFCFWKAKYEVYIPKKYHDDLKLSITTGDITFKNSNEVYNFSSVKLNSTTGDINIESPLETGELYINGKVGDVKTDSLKTNDFTLKMTTGDVKISSLKSKKTDIYTTVGTIKIQNLETQGQIRTTTGDVNIENFKLIGDTKINCTTGDVNVQLTKDNDCNVILDTKLGDKTLPNNSSLVGSGKYKFNLKTTTGDVEVRI